jgi:hypothetical protein
VSLVEARVGIEEIAANIRGCSIGNGGGKVILQMRTYAWQIQDDVDADRLK